MKKLLLLSLLFSCQEEKKQPVEPTTPNVRFYNCVIHTNAKDFIKITDDKTFFGCVIYVDTTSKKISSPIVQVKQKYHSVKKLKKRFYYRIKYSVYVNSNLHILGDVTFSDYTPIEKDTLFLMNEIKRTNSDEVDMDSAFIQINKATPCKSLEDCERYSNPNFKHGIKNY
jgi:hypothetical protein